MEATTVEREETEVPEASARVRNVDPGPLPAFGGVGRGNGVPRGGLVVEPEIIKAYAQALRPLLKAVHKEMPTGYDPRCLKIACAWDFDPNRNRLWANMLYRAVMLFEEFNGDESDKSHTSGYEAVMTGPFAARVDKPAPTPEGETMTTNREGPYDVDLLHGECQCRFKAGHPWALYVTGEGEREYVAHGTEARELSDWRHLQPFFPELNWTPQTPGCVWVDTGSDPAIDCKHLTGAYLVACACQAHALGLVAALPEATQKIVGRLLEVARKFRLFPELRK